jgi:hypothetical protein
MTDDDREPFDRVFRRLALAFRLRLKPEALDDLAGAYFHVLKSHPLDVVLTAGQTCLRQGRVFPKPAQWLAELTRGEVGAPPDVRIMSMVEAAEYVRAERLHYDDDPCACLLCQSARIERPLRFVPDYTDDGRPEQAFCPLKNRVVVAGHWAHGDELVRWYIARDAFFGLGGPAGAHIKVLRRYGFIYTPPPGAPYLQLSEREPGMEG